MSRPKLTVVESSGVRTERLKSVLRGIAERLSDRLKVKVVAFRLLTDQDYEIRIRRPKWRICGVTLRVEEEVLAAIHLTWERHVCVINVYRQDVEHLIVDRLQQLKEKQGGEEVQVVREYPSSAAVLG